MKQDGRLLMNWHLLVAAEAGVAMQGCSLMG